jgi:zinc transport system substrate-binding protein
MACTVAEEGAPVPSREDASSFVVYTVSEPLRYFAERIGGGLVEVHFPVPPEVVDPALWNPDPETVAAYQRADLVLLNGGGYAGWVERASLRSGRLVDTSAAFHDRMIPLEELATHAHGPEGEHSHTGFATSFWLDVELARGQARAIADAFARARPGDAEGFRERFDALDADLAALDTRLAESAAPLAGRPILFSHPVYPYLSRRYGIAGQSLHWEPDAIPNLAEWDELKRILVTYPARIMIWEDTPHPDTVEGLADLDIEVVVFLPVAGRSEPADFLATMNENARRLALASRYSGGADR